MANEKYEKLTNCEELVMKIIWDADEDLSMMEIVHRANEKYNKDWKPQTVSTFLSRLITKGYLEYYRNGRVFYYKTLIPLEKYKIMRTCEYVDFWFHGNADEFISTLIKTRPLRPEEKEKIELLIVNEAARQPNGSISAKVDHGKILALYKARWSVPKIADEMGISPGVVEKVIRQRIAKVKVGGGCT